MMGVVLIILAVGLVGFAALTITARVLERLLPRVDLETAAGRKPACAAAHMCRAGRQYARPAGSGITRLRSCRTAANAGACWWMTRKEFARYAASLKTWRKSANVCAFDRGAGRWRRR